MNTKQFSVIKINDNQSIVYNPSACISVGDWVVDTADKSIWVDTAEITVDYTDTCFKIVAAIGIKLDGLPLVDLYYDIRHDYINRATDGWDDETKEKYMDNVREDCREYMHGYKVAEEKMYTIDDVKDAIIHGMQMGFLGLEDVTTAAADYIESLKPDRIIVEIELECENVVLIIHDEEHDMIGPILVKYK